MPRVSILVSTYKGEKYLGQAIGSLLNQSFTDFELIVVDDASVDTTWDILQHIHDRRLVLFRNDNNLGIGASLNRALQAAKGEFIAVQDHDDISLPNRFQEQVEFLRSRTDVALVGSPGWVIDGEGLRTGMWRVPQEDIDLKWGILINEPFLHTGVMFRRNVLEHIGGGYSTDPIYRFAEDYELLSRIATQFRVANLSNPLVCWREHRSSASDLNRFQQEQASFHISLRNIRRLIPDTDVHLRRLVQVLMQTKPGTPTNISDTEVRLTIGFLCSLLKAFYERHDFTPSQVRAHRRHVQWKIGKHLVALAYRRDGKRNLSCRVALLASVFKLAFQITRDLVFKSGDRDGRRKIKRVSPENESATR
jgi:glycosyltransferase involved in cell wall biosynthesis